MTFSTSLLTTFALALAAAAAPPASTSLPASSTSLRSSSTSLRSSSTSTSAPSKSTTPTNTNPNECASIPSSADPNVLTAVYTISRARNVTDRVLLATFETAWIESHANNLNCGDQDSVGVFQQRPSQGWGSIAQCTNVTYATNSFLNGAIWNDGKFPKYTAGQLAQSVQVSEFPDRYDQAEAIAKGLIAQAQRALGVPVSTPALSATQTAVVPVISSSQTVTQTMATISGTPGSSMPVSSMIVTFTTSGSVTSTIAPAPTNPVAPPTPPQNDAVLAPGTLDMTCGALYNVASGDTCGALQRWYGASLAQLRFWNPSINSKCTNLQVGYVYCASSQVAVPPSTAASGINKQGCTGYSSKIKKDESCTAVGKKYGVSVARLRTLNKSLNSKCSNIVVGKSYCITSIGS